MSEHRRATVTAHPQYEGDRLRRYDITIELCEGVAPIETPPVLGHELRLRLVRLRAGS